MKDSLLLTLIILFLFCSSFFSLSQIAFFSLPTTFTTHYKKSSGRIRIIALLLAQPHKLLITLVFCDIGVNVGIQNCVAMLLKDKSSWLLTVGIPLSLTLILGEVLPKAIALPFNKKIAFKISPFISLIVKTLAPILYLPIIFVNYLSRLIIPKQPTDPIQPSELKEVLQSCKDFGVVSQEEGRLIHGYLSLDCSVKERMKPRHEILFYDIKTPISELYALFSQKQCSRVPVCNDNIQNLLGICSAKSLLLLEEPLTKSQDLIPLLKKPYYMPETISAKTALLHLAAAEETLGMIIDEYGSIEGLITQEDLFEIITGEIIDERDEKSPYTTSGQNVIITAGKLELSEFNEIFHINLPTNNNVATIGGWLTEQLGTIPETGMKFIWRNNLLFQVLDAAPNCVRRVYIRRLHD